MIRDEKIHLIPHGIDFDFFKPSNFSELIKKYDLSKLNDKKIILYVGRISQRKGIDILVKAFSRVARELNKKKKYPAVIYIHPWEFDLYHPRIKSIVWYNYYRLHTTEWKFKKLLKEFKFISIRDWMENEM